MRLISSFLKGSFNLPLYTDDQEAYLSDILENYDLSESYARDEAFDYLIDEGVSAPQAILLVAEAQARASGNRFPKEFSNIEISACYHLLLSQEQKARYRLKKEPPSEPQAGLQRDNDDYFLDKYGWLIQIIKDQVRRGKLTREQALDQLQNLDTMGDGLSKLSAEDAGLFLEPNNAERLRARTLNNPRSPWGDSLPKGYSDKPRTPVISPFKEDEYNGKPGYLKRPDGSFLKTRNEDYYNPIDRESGKRVPRDEFLKHHPDGMYSEVVLSLDTQQIYSAVVEPTFKGFPVLKKVVTALPSGDANDVINILKHYMSGSVSDIQADIQLRAHNIDEKTVDKLKKEFNRFGDKYGRSIVETPVTEDSVWIVKNPVMSAAKTAKRPVKTVHVNINDPKVASQLPKYQDLVRRYPSAVSSLDSLGTKYLNEQAFGGMLVDQRAKTLAPAMVPQYESDLTTKLNRERANAVSRQALAPPGSQSFEGYRQQIEAIDQQLTDAHATAEDQALQAAQKEAQALASEIAQFRAYQNKEYAADAKRFSAGRAVANIPRHAATLGLKGIEKATQAGTDFTQGKIFKPIDDFADATIGRAWNGLKKAVAPKQRVQRKIGNSFELKSYLSELVQALDDKLVSVNSIYSIMSSLGFTEEQSFRFVNEVVPEVILSDVYQASALKDPTPSIKKSFATGVMDFKEAVKALTDFYVDKKGAEKTAAERYAIGVVHSWTPKGGPPPEMPKPAQPKQTRPNIPAQDPAQAAANPAMPMEGSVPSSSGYQTPEDETMAQYMRQSFIPLMQTYNIPPQEKLAAFYAAWNKRQIPDKLLKELFRRMGMDQHEIEVAYAQALQMRDSIFTEGADNALHGKPPYVNPNIFSSVAKFNFGDIIEIEGHIYRLQGPCDSDLHEFEVEAMDGPDVGDFYSVSLEDLDRASLIEKADNTDDTNYTIVDANAHLFSSVDEVLNYARFLQSKGYTEDYAEKLAKEHFDVPLSSGRVISATVLDVLSGTDLPGEYSKGEEINKQPIKSDTEYYVIRDSCLDGEFWDDYFIPVNSDISSLEPSFKKAIEKYKSKTDKESAEKTEIESIVKAAFEVCSDLGLPEGMAVLTLEGTANQDSPLSQFEGGTEPLSRAVMAYIAFSFRNSLHHLHLHLTGRDFLDVHEYLGELYEEALENADYWAERAIQNDEDLQNFNGVAQNSLVVNFPEESQNTYSIPEYAKALDKLGNAYLEALKVIRPSMPENIQSDIDSMYSFWDAEINYKNKRLLMGLETEESGSGVSATTGTEVTIMEA